MSGEPPDVYTITTPVARKAHRCCECGSLIHPGEQYQRFSGIWNGAPGSYATCSDCNDLREEVKDMTPFPDEWPAFEQLGRECAEYGGDLEKKFKEIKTRRAQRTTEKRG